MAAYQRFDNLPPYPTQSSSNPMQPMVLNAPSALVQPTPEKKLKSWSALKMMVLVQLGLAAFMIVMEAIVDIVISTAGLRYSAPCSFGTGVWVGVLGVIAGGLGYGAFKTPYGHKCMMVANFVMSIIGTVADGIMIIFAGICLANLPWATHGYYDYNMGSWKPAPDWMVLVIRGMIALEVFLLLAAIGHFIISIVLTAFICRNWCQGKQPTVAVVYVHGTNQSTPGTDPTDPYSIAVPPGTNIQQYVIFVPLGTNGQQANAAQQPPQPEFRDVQGLGDSKRV